MEQALGSISLILILFGVVIAVLWIMLPFAVFGIKDLAKALISEQKKTNELLRKLTQQKDFPEDTV
jgi:predicted PurR-regulated permease PerM